MELILYREEQRMTQWWVWTLVLLIAGVSWWGFTAQIIFKQTFGNNPAPDWMMIVIWIAFGIGFPVFMASVRLITEVRADGLYVRMIPFHFKYKSYQWGDIEKYYARTYRPIMEYGGWGIRYGVKGMAYNISGNRGLQLELVWGKHVLIGSQSPEDLVRAMDQGAGNAGRFPIRE